MYRKHKTKIKQMSKNNTKSIKNTQAKQRTINIQQKRRKTGRERKEQYMRGAVIKKKNKNKQNNIHNKEKQAVENEHNTNKQMTQKHTVSTQTIR